MDISKDVNNCRICGRRCPTIGNWRCCNGFCANINFDPLNCGGCGRICPIMVCLMGECRYTKSSSPTTFLP
ncbi:putative stigma-specific protein Stig1 [Medicago truncatula]|uniref:Putative stigma-specific protein Stig1 n=1 Tax=Medicago truncatula TaxID=3880 RepID=A0A396GPP4_MEDTR|nr:putative stigma-specific protein Stig1 [Medicago truncatula]